MSQRLRPGQIRIGPAGEAPPMTMEVVAGFLLCMAVFVGALWALIWGIGFTFRTMDHYYLAHKEVGAPPRPPGKYAAFVATDEDGNSRAVVFSYESLQIVQVSSATRIPPPMRARVTPFTAGNLVTWAGNEFLYPKPVIIEGTDISITTGPLVGHDAVRAALRLNHQGLTDASIQFAYPDSRGPPLNTDAGEPDYSMDKDGRQRRGRFRVVYVIGQIHEVDLFSLHDQSKLDLFIFDRSRKDEDGRRELRPSRSELVSYYESAYEWNKLASAHGMETLPINLRYSSRELRSKMGAETEADREQEIKERAIRALEVRERGRP